MIVVVRKARPGNVFATHEGYQRANALASYPEDEFEVYSFDGVARSLGPVPEGLTPIRLTVEGFDPPA